MTRGAAAPETAASRVRANAALVPAVILFAATVPLSIAAAQISLTAIFLIWILAGRPRWPREASQPVWAAALYALWTMASALASARPMDSLRDTKELLLLTTLLLVPTACAQHRHLAKWTLHAWLGGCLASATVGLVTYFRTPGGLEYRASGPFGHYMTFGGMMMLGAVTAVVLILDRRVTISRLAACALVPILLAVAVSWARNAWLGLLAGLAVATTVMRPRWLPGLTVATLLALLLAPTDLRERFASSFDPGANQDRVAMLQFGRELVVANPWMGVGPNRIPDAWRAAHPGERVQPHLHNNILQIAAERGVPALLAWLWLLSAVVIRGWRQYLRLPPALQPALALAVTAALLVAGMFEYNFGDSEVKMAFLLLVSLSTTPGDPSPSVTS